MHKNALDCMRRSVVVFVGDKKKVGGHLDIKSRKGRLDTLRQIFWDICGNEGRAVLVANLDGIEPRSCPPEPPWKKNGALGLKAHQRTNG
jgi:hypothetical protein